jgi:regulator of RNase E activity RraA
MEQPSPLPSADQLLNDPIPWLRSVDTPTLSNAIELLQVRPKHEGFAPLQLRSLFPEFGVMAGYAVTAQVETVTRPEPVDWDRFLELFAAVKASPQPAVVCLQEIGGHADFAAHAGEVMCTAFRRLGAVGLVSDCAVRDIPEVKNLGFHYFARGTVASHANFRIIRIGVDIQILGLPIRPGEIIHGDINGLLSVPEEGLADLPAKVQVVRDKEGPLLQFMRSEEFTLDGLRGILTE